MPVTFTKVSLPFGWLGNMAPYPITHEGEEWRSTEHLFQALRFDDTVIRKEIQSAKSPFGAKLVAKKYADKMTVQPMSVKDLRNMDFVVRLKVKQHPELQEMLLATGDETIIEDVTSRPSGGRHLFWGMALREGVWVGDNYLGKLWMRIRKELRDGRSDEERDVVSAPAAGL